MNARLTYGGHLSTADCSAPGISLLTSSRALIGYRWFKTCVGGRPLPWEGRRTGNPVRIRDGPRRCNRVLEGPFNLLAIVA